MEFDEFFARMTGYSSNELDGPTSASSAETSNASGLTPLAAACKAGNFGRAITMLRNGADPNELSSDGRTPLFYCDEVAFVSLLLHFGANVNSIDNEGNTALFKFLQGDNINSNAERAIVVLIEEGADVDIRNNEGLSARDVAKTKAADELRAAFDQGLRVIGGKKQALEERFERQRAERKEWYEEADPLNTNTDFNHVSGNCFNACFLSDIRVLKINEDWLRQFISMTITTGNSNEQSMLMAACSCASVEIVEYLISLGADVNQVDGTGQAPLRYASVSWRDTRKKIELLLDAGADINHLSNDGSAALSDAAFHRNVIAAKTLIAHGADVNNRDNRGYTALSWTCGQGVPDADIVELLLRSGADVYDLYAMNCVLQFIDYYSAYGRTLSRTVTLRQQDITERHLYEHSLLPALCTSSGREKLEAQGFVF